MQNSTIITCPHCVTSNRVPTEKLEYNPVCGKCRHKLFYGNTVELNAGNAQAFMQKNEIPLIIDFWAPWCGPCQKMGPAFLQAATELEPGFRLCKLDTEKNPKLASQFSIRGIPTLIIYRNGHEIARHTGLIGSSDIVDWARNQVIPA